MADTQRNSDLEGIAIVGMAGRFPGARSPDELWRNLCEGKESITFFSDEELDPGIDPVLKNRPNYIRARGVFPDIDRFDAKFFGMSPREAEVTDPQHRIFLEICWEALENAGYAPDTYDGLIGVFAGSGFNTYLTNNLLMNQGVVESVGRHLVELGNAPDYLVTRVSFKLNLKGPSVSVYTGCSSSLVAVCHAFDSLMNFQSDMAIAGGIYIACPPNSGYLYQVGEMLSIDGHTRPFDADAQGTVFSCGGGAVVLKRLEDAIRDRDFIYGVIRGTGVNNDGSDKVSFSAPSVKGQAEAIAMAQASAGFDAETITYVETHGTGTPLGDPIEIEALTRAYRMKTDRKCFCALGAIKANIGHLDAAAGIAGLIKTALALHHKTLPPSINFANPNPRIDFDNSPFYVNKELRAWDTGSTPRRAGISSFGVGGTNAHVVLEEAPRIIDSTPSRQWQVLTVSGKTEGALQTAMANLADFLEIHDDSNLEDAALTLQTGRKHFNHRCIAVCRDHEDAIRTLRTPDTRKVITGSGDLIERDVVFMFSGQGSQYPNMGRDIYGSEPLFREEIDRCADVLAPHLDLDLRDVVYPKPENVEQSAEMLQQTYLTQTALFAVDYALARLWMSWGIRPSVLVGHSIGEYVAACISGVFSVEDALKIVAARGRLMQELPRGSMVAVFLPEKEVEPFLEESTSVSVVNGPSLCVVSGEHNAIQRLEEKLSDSGIRHRRLQTSHAFHSSMMEPMLASFERELEQVAINPPSIPFLSNVTGNVIPSEDATSPAYWCDHLRKTVRFSACLETVLEKGNRVLLEVGPGNTLATLARQHPAMEEGHIILSTTRHPNEDMSDRAYLLRSAGQLWLANVQPDWRALYDTENRRPVPLPSYPFQRERHWVEPDRSAFGQGTTTSGTTGFASNRERVEEGPEPVDAARDGKTAEGSVEATLTSVWKKLLGCRHIDLHDNYFDLGGNSLMAVRLFVQIENLYGKRLPLATLYEAPTIRELAGVIKEKTYIPSWKSLVAIQTEGTRPPFFCMHAEGGNVLEYQPLAKLLGKDQPFYGLQAQGLEGTEIVNPSIEEMAAHNIWEIKTIQARGPYYLGGYCLGGLVAFEMAHQLQEAGEEVAFLGFISTSTGDHLRDVKSRMTLFRRLAYKVLERVELELSNLYVLTTKAKYLYVIDRMIRAARKVQFRIEKALDRLFIRLHREYKWHSRGYILQTSVDLSDDAYMSYRPKPLDNDLYLFRVSKRRRELNFDPLLGWGGLAGKGIEVFEVHGFHKNIMKEPNVRAVAKILKRLLIEKQRAYDGSS